MTHEDLTFYFISKGFKSDSCPNYEAYIINCISFNLIVQVHLMGFDICIFGIDQDSASDPRGERPDMFRYLAKNINFERMNEYVILLTNNSDRV